MNILNIIFKRPYDFFISDELRHDTVVYNHAKTLVAVGVVACLMVPFFIVFYYSINREIFIPAVILFGIFIYLSLIIMKKTNIILVTREIITLCLTILCISISLTLGGLVGPSPYWLVVPPIINLLTGGFLTCVIWGFINSGVAFALYYFSDIESAILTIEGPHYFSHTLISIISLIFVTLTLTYISELEKTRSMKAQYRAYHDALTGALNRYAFQDRLQKIFNKKGRQDSYHLICIDIDHFENINETLGFAAGDFILKQLYIRLKHFFYDERVIGRMANDEYFIFATKKYPLDELLPYLNDPYVFTKETEIRPSYSVGVVNYPEDANTYTQLIQYAYLALNSSQNAGGNQLRAFTREMAANEKTRLHIQHQLPIALKNKEFYLHFQPKYSCASPSRIIGMEVLVRWNNPKLGIVPPELFIPIAEKIGLISTIGDWVLKEALTQFKEWKQEGLIEETTTLSVNFSMAQLYRSNTFEKIKTILSLLDISAQHLEIEITESTIMKNKKYVLDLLHQLKVIGVAIAIDDFGTGYSSLSYISQIPLSSVKIDKTFIDDIALKEKLVRSIINMVHGLNLKVVAEGVETKEQYEILKTMACDNIQGFYFSKPLDSLEMKQLLQESSK